MCELLRACMCVHVGVGVGSGVCHCWVCVCECMHGKKTESTGRTNAPYKGLHVSLTRSSIV
jgi:hypothetical protein